MVASLGQVDVDVRLNLDKMRADSAAAQREAAKIQQSLQKSLSGTPRTDFTKPFKDAQREASKFVSDIKKIEAAAKAARASLQSMAAPIATPQATGGGNKARPVQQLGQDAEQAAGKIGLANHEVTNLGFQLNDMAQGLATGQQSVFTILIQQGAQVSQILGNRPGGLGGALSALRQGFMSFLNPVTLTIAGLAAATLAVDAFISSGEKTETVTEVLERQKELVDELRQKYVEVDDAVKAYEKTLTGIDARFSLSRTKTELESARKAANQAQEEFRATAIAITGVLTPEARADLTGFLEFQREARALVEDFDQGRISGEELLATLSEIADKNPDSEIAKLAAQLRDSAVATVDARRNFSQLVSVLGGVEQAASRVGQAFAAIGQPTVPANLQTRLEEALARKVDVPVPGGKPIDLGRPAPRRGGPKLDEFQSQVKSTQELIYSLQTEAAAYGMTESAAARYRVERDLLSAAQQTGGTVTETERKEIEKLTAQYQAANDNAEGMRKIEEQRNRTLSDLQNISTSALSGFIKDMREGVSVTEALGNALTRVADKLLDMAISNLVGNAFGAVGGAGTLGPLGGIFSLFGFANGGVMSSGGPLPLKTYSNGGIANSPQLAVYGEGRMNEAYVPLPDGRTIPVTMTGAANQNASPTSNVFNMPISIDATGADPATLVRVIDQVEQLRREVPAMAVTAVNRSQKRRIGR